MNQNQVRTVLVDDLTNEQRSQASTLGEGEIVLCQEIEYIDPFNSTRTLGLELYMETQTSQNEGCGYIWNNNRWNKTID